MTTLHQLAEDWPDWRVWSSQRGELACATRQYGPGYTLIGNNPDDLLAQLQAEPKREGAAP